MAEPEANAEADQVADDDGAPLGLSRAERRGVTAYSVVLVAVPTIAALVSDASFALADHFRVHAMWDKAWAVHIVNAALGSGISAGVVLALFPAPGRRHAAALAAFGFALGVYVAASTMFVAIRALTPLFSDSLGLWLDRLFHLAGLR